MASGSDERAALKKLRDLAIELDRARDSQHKAVKELQSSKASVRRSKRRSATQLVTRRAKDGDATGSDRDALYRKDNRALRVRNGLLGLIDSPLVVDASAA